MSAAGEGAQLPLIVFPNGTILENPTNAEIAVATGGPVNPGQIEFDVVIVGAGPAGLSAAVYGASEGFGTLVVDKGDGQGGDLLVAKLPFDAAFQFGCHLAIWILRGRDTGKEQKQGQHGRTHGDPS